MGVPRFVAEYRNYAQRLVDKSALTQEEKDEKTNALNYIYSMTIVGAVSITDAMRMMSDEADIREEKKMERFYYGLITYKHGGEKIADVTVHKLYEFEDVQKAIDRHVTLTVEGLKIAGAEIKDVVENYIVYNFEGEEYVDEILIYDERGIVWTTPAHFCSECGELMIEGYCISDGFKYFCSDECLYKNYSKEEYDKMYEEDNAYWAQWY